MTFTVTVTGGASAEVYGGLDALNAYASLSIGTAAAAYVALTGDTPAQCLVKATRFIDSQVWQGTPTTPAVGGTALQWPRTGVVDEYGVAVDASTVPVNVVNAAFELAMLAAANPATLEAVDQGTNIKSVHGGPAGVDYFVPTSAANGTAPLFPPVVQRLIAQYLGSAVDSIGGGIKTGGEGRSEFARDRFKRSWPF